MTGPVADAPPRKVPYSFTYEVPQEFIRLPEPTASEGWRESMAKLMPEADDEQLTQASEQIRAQLPKLSGQDTTVLTAMCVGTEEVDGDERLSMGLLAVSVRPSGHQDRLLAAEGIFRAKEKSFFAHEGKLQDLDFPLGKGVQGRQDMLLAAKLPCGPGVMSTSLRTMTLPMAAGVDTGTGTGTGTEAGGDRDAGSGAEAPVAVPVSGERAAADTTRPTVTGAVASGPAGADPAAAGPADSAGSAASSRTDSRTAAAGTGTGTPDAGARDTGRPAPGPPVRPSIAVAALQLIIPAPRDYCVYVTISTPSVFLLDSYSGRLAHIARTFSFDVSDAEADTNANTNTNKETNASGDTSFQAVRRP